MMLLLTYLLVLRELRDDVELELAREASQLGWNLKFRAPGGLVESPRSRATSIASL
jgi:hypothetical protein